MSGIILCSSCFKDQGLKLNAIRIGIDDDTQCPNCKVKDGRKLDKGLVHELASIFFVSGSIVRTDFGGAPLIQFNEHQYQKTQIDAGAWLENDVKLIEKAIKVGFFYYGPRLWMVGEVYPLRDLNHNSKRQAVIKRILEEYPQRIMTRQEQFFRLRVNPDHPANHQEYDSAQDKFLGGGRLDSRNLPVFYGSQDLEVCMHECRVSIEDELFVASLSPKVELKLLDLTEILNEQCSEFESLDMAIHMLFLAGKHSYNVTREIALAASRVGYDGIIYPSYFSLVRTGTVPFDTIYGMSIRRFSQLKEQANSGIIGNIGLFGRPIKENKIEITGINRLAINQVKYNMLFGPVLFSPDETIYSKRSLLELYRESPHQPI